ncbi:hypothetical protein FOZ76_15110 [Verticiella sediminum]|uniref:Uncharacterized protein n=1 Tax=Verticiella sediminum TaxID=1247510 RepID=A0A556AIN3_9BURK|nr:hypothetical protein [Verticiella sediminum]TSH92737.1 hypothetical protein FOZ76_15110 [Verticiella sediminum]
MEQFPTIKLLVEHGTAIAVLVAVLPLIGAWAAFELLSLHWLVLAAGLVSSAVLLLIMKSYVELVRVVSEMLLPK